MSNFDNRNPTRVRRSDDDGGREIGADDRIKINMDPEDALRVLLTTTKPKK